MVEGARWGLGDLPQEVLPRSFYLQDGLALARQLLGAILVHCTWEGVTAGRIVETEAYLGPQDAAAHSFRGRRQGRTSIQYGLGGYAYIYLIYGMHYCMNIVAGPVEQAEAVLIRALEPVAGQDLMARRRRTEKPLQWCSGPGKLCQAMAIDQSCYGLDLCGDRLYLVAGPPPASSEVLATKRINVDYAGPAKDYLWRYILKDNPHVSVKVKG